VTWGGRKIPELSLSTQKEDLRSFSEGVKVNPEHSLDRGKRKNRAFVEGKNNVDLSEKST